MAASRCKSCGAGLSEDLTLLQRLSEIRPWRTDQQLCQACFVRISSQPSSEAPVSLLFAQLRIPELLAERTPSRDFRTLLRRLYETAESAVDDYGGIMTTMGGNTVLALWSPQTGAPDHAGRALRAGTRLVEQLDSDRTLKRRIRAGVAVHTGSAAVDLTGTPRSHRFEVGGSAVTTVEELAADAADNQLRASAAILAATETR